MASRPAISTKLFNSTQLRPVSRRFHVSTHTGGGSGMRRVKISNWNLEARTEHQVFAACFHAGRCGDAFERAAQSALGSSEHLQHARVRALARDAGLATSHLMTGRTDERRTTSRKPACRNADAIPVQAKTSGIGFFLGSTG